MVYRIVVTKYGYADVVATDADEALRIANEDMLDRDFDWSEFDEPEIVEEYEEEDYFCTI